MSSSDTVEFNTKGLDQLIKAMKAENVVARVGVLGFKNVRSGGGSNASIGAAHEFGTAKLPQRSFLRMPLTTKLPTALEKSGAFNKDVLKKVVKSGSLAAWVEKIAILAVSIIQEAFDTGGFGQWKPSNMDRKTVKQTLVETQQLRNSITYEVKGG